MKTRLTTPGNCRELLQNLPAFAVVTDDEILAF